MLSVILVVGAILAFIVVFRLLQKGAFRAGVRRIMVVAAVLGFYVYETLQLQKVSPEEAMHFLQYGLLYALAFRAFGLRYRQTPALVSAWLFLQFFVG